MVNNYHYVKKKEKITNYKDLNSIYHRNYYLFVCYHLEPREESIGYF